MRVALAQILGGADPAANLQLVRDYAGSRRRRRELVVSRGAHVPFRRPAGTDRRARQRALGKRSPRIETEPGITVIPGMFAPAGDGRVTNTLIAAGPGTPNEPDGHYHKIHLYDAFGFTESRTVAPGHEPVIITVDESGWG